MRTLPRIALAAFCIALASVVLTVKLTWDGCAVSTQATAEQPSLTVAVARLRPAIFPIRIAANGNIMAWQEASIGTETDGLRLIDVKVSVGDKVRRGQALATFASDTVEAELAHSRAAVAEAEVALTEAAIDAQRARVLQETGALSAQQIRQYVAAERTAWARLAAARAVERTQELRLARTRITAVDDGVISARTATVGAVLPAGQELFRLIRGGRLEWRAEVASADLVKLESGHKTRGHKARIALPGGRMIEGRLRMLSPVIDIPTRNGLAYVDLPPSDTARTGMFARGEIELGAEELMALPQSAIRLREGFSYVMRVGPDSRVIQTRVTAGRRSDDCVEIISGLGTGDRVVVSGAAFLGDGDLVRVADALETAVPARSSSPPRHRTLTDSGGAR